MILPRLSRQCDHRLATRFGPVGESRICRPAAPRRLGKGRRVDAGSSLSTGGRNCQGHAIAAADGSSWGFPSVSGGFASGRRRFGSCRHDSRWSGSVWSCRTKRLFSR